MLMLHASFADEMVKIALSGYASTPVHGGVPQGAWGPEAVRGGSSQGARRLAAWSTKNPVVESTKQQAGAAATLPSTSTSGKVRGVVDAPIKMPVKNVPTKVPGPSRRMLRILGKIK